MLANNLLRMESRLLILKVDYLLIFLFPVILFMLVKPGLIICRGVPSIQIPDNLFFSCPGSSIYTWPWSVSQWVSEWVTATLEFRHKEGLSKLETFQTSDQSDVQTKRQKKTKKQHKKTKKKKWIQRKKKRRKHKKKKDSWQRPKSLILWRQGSFALLNCFSVTKKLYFWVTVLYRQ